MAARTQGVQALDSFRATYRALKRKFAVGSSDCIVTPGYLRSEVVLGTQNSIGFNILVNEGGAARSTERRLAVSDAFVLTHIGVMIGRLTGAAPETTPGPIELETFVNGNVFTVAAEAAALRTMFNGFLTVKVGSITYIEALDVLRFKRAGEAQRGQLIAAGGAAYSASNFDGMQSLADIVPTIQLTGQSKNVVTISLPESAAMGAVAPITNVAAFYGIGFLVQNGANFKPRQMAAKLDARRSRR